MSLTIIFIIIYAAVVMVAVGVENALEERGYISHYDIDWIIGVTVVWPLALCFSPIVLLIGGAYKLALLIIPKKK